MRHVIVLLLALPAAAQYGNPGSGEASITAEDLSKHLELLAADEMKGRLAGSPEAERAAEHIAAHMKEHGLVPWGRPRAKDYFHPFKLRGRACRNVVGLLPGRDGSLRRQYVVVGAHFDHVGLGRNGSRSPGRAGEVHNGADDNASGTSALLELVEAFSGKAPRRSVLFVAFSGEEAGLVGSEAFCKDPTVPLKSVVAMLNLDMVGRSSDDYLFVGGINTGRGFRKLVEDVNETYEFQLELSGGGRGPSDMDSFYKRDVPVLFLFTAEHPDYHTPDDDIEKVDVEALARITRMSYALVGRLGNGRRPRFQKDDRQSMPATSSRAPDHANILLGMALGRAESGQEGVPVRRVRGNRGAGRVGIREGDLILEVDGEPVSTRVEVQRLLAPKPLKSRIRLKVQRGRAKRTVTIRT